MFKGLTSRVNALSKVSRISSFKTRKMIADGIVMSKLLYLIQWWGGGSAYLLQYLQVLQNRAARMVTKLSWSTSTSKLLNQLGWLSVKQLVEFHSLTLLFKMISQAKPAYFHDKLNTEFPYPTRLAAGNGLRRLETYQYDATKMGFVHRTSVTWNLLPSNIIRTAETLTKFKKSLKPWIQKNVPI